MSHEDQYTAPQPTVQARVISALGRLPIMFDIRDIFTDPTKGDRYGEYIAVNDCSDRTE